jgi:dienelactone hydrolase
MQNNRRKFLKLAGLSSIGITSGGLTRIFASEKNYDDQKINSLNTSPTVESNQFDGQDVTIIGLYGKWANALNENKLPTFSFRRGEWKNLQIWKKKARQRLTERLAVPDIGGMPKVTVTNQFSYDGLHIEEISWQLPYGRPTEAILLKPQNAKGKLPAILAFHDHGGNKYFGCRKITRTSSNQHTLMNEHQQEYYSNLAWANEIAKRGYVVLVPDAFTFGSRRVLLQDVPAPLRKGLNDEDHENPANINAYNKWAGEHEHIMAKSLFCAGTTWPGVFFAEDKKALDILSAREDVDKSRIGCGGLSGGGLRTVMMAGIDERIKCAVDVGFMSTWKDFLLHKSYTHTWMLYVPLLPNELDFPEILGIRTPLPTLVLNDNEDDLYSLPEMKRAEEILKQVYTKANAKDRFKCSYYPGPHKFDAAMQQEAFDWFDKWLKP